MAQTPENFWVWVDTTFVDDAHPEYLPKIVMLFKRKLEANAAKVPLYAELREKDLLHERGKRLRREIAFIDEIIMETNARIFKIKPLVYNLLEDYIAGMEASPDKKEDKNTAIMVQGSLHEKFHKKLTKEYDDYKERLDAKHAKQMKTEEEEDEEEEEEGEIEMTSGFVNLFR